MNPNRIVSAVFVALLVASVGVAPTSAQAGPAWAQDAYDRFADRAPTFNEMVDGVDLGPAGDRLAGRSANVYVESDDGAAVFSFAMDEDNHVTDLRPEARDDADLEVRTDRATVEAIATADNPAGAFRDAYKGGDIAIGTTGGFTEAVSDGPSTVVDWAFWTVADTLKGFL